MNKYVAELYRFILGHNRSTWIEYEYLDSRTNKGKIPFGRDYINWLVDKLKSL